MTAFLNTIQCAVHCHVHFAQGIILYVMHFRMHFEQCIILCTTHFVPCTYCTGSCASRNLPSIVIRPWHTRHCFAFQLQKNYILQQSCMSSTALYLTLQMSHYESKNPSIQFSSHPEYGTAPPRGGSGEEGQVTKEPPPVSSASCRSVQQFQDKFVGEQASMFTAKYFLDICQA